MKQCEWVAGEKNCTSAFEGILNHFNGFNLCDYCPYADCIASQTQQVRLQRIEQEYRENHMPACDKRVREYREIVTKALKKAEKQAQKNPTGRHRGRPRKVEIA